MKLRLSALLISCMAVSSLLSMMCYDIPPASSIPTHPLDPLTITEINAAVSTIQSDSRYAELQATNPGTPPVGILFDRVELKEPAKDYVLAFDEAPFTTPLKRVVYATIYGRITTQYYQIYIDVSNVTSPVITKWEQVCGAKIKCSGKRRTQSARPPYTATENAEVINIITTYQPFIDAMALRGISSDDINNGYVSLCVALDGRLDNIKRGLNCKGLTPFLGGCPRIRAYYAFAFWNDGNINPDYVNTMSYYSQPIAGVTVWVDETTMTVVDLIDTGVEPVRMGTIASDIYNLNTRVPALNPLCTSQCGGPSYTLNENNSVVTWDKWKIRFSLHPRFGLVLYEVDYFDDNVGNSAVPVQRRILYRANLAEGITAYGTPNFSTKNHNFFDFVGEYYSKVFITPLTPGLEVPCYATLFNGANFTGDDGTLNPVPCCLALYEQDAGLLWRHYNGMMPMTFGARGTELVFTYINTIGNYDYIVSYTFGQNGIIKVSVTPTGQNEFGATYNTNAADAGKYDPLVQPNLTSPNHQHLFNFRLDFDVDYRPGSENPTTHNQILEANSCLVKPSKDNPCGNGLVSNMKVLSCVPQGLRNCNFETNRYWIIQNPNVTAAYSGINAIPGYALMPSANYKSFFNEKERIAKRATYAEHNVFVTQYRDDQLDVVGLYPAEQGIDSGLNQYICNKDNLVNEDLVVWYTMVFAHFPAPEDYPILGANHSLSFMISPESFFAQNPAMDVPIAPCPVNCCCEVNSVKNMSKAQ